MKNARKNVNVRRNRPDKDARRRGAPDPDAASHCACCCDTETLNQLAKVAYEMNPDGCPLEPSRRVREMAVEAIEACGIECNYAPYYQEEEIAPPATDEVGDGVDEDGGGELVPPAQQELVPIPSDRTGLILPSVTRIEPISALSTVCLVSLKQGQRLEPNPLYSATYRGRLYYFANKQAVSEFNDSPEEYAVAFGGCDPVHYVKTYEAVEGRYLVLHEDRFYMFATKDNYEQFKQNLNRFVPQSQAADPIAQQQTEGSEIARVSDESTVQKSETVEDVPFLLPTCSRNTRGAGRIENGDASRP